ncbi:bacteriophage abortive infection AbiH family protein [Faecalispora anaeroviscerum]|uniref:bacteriophage abortive infection AbiH family protein n=1 Tax=Faecalispora anaeroviscerum TaxID=2991836 RepID=UPI0024BA21E2|nr:bacteriophage abortive infection AbiH family protein [Faecalispora anaeroviscerum]
MINNLFVIGNGFDIGHKMNTSYLEFKKWLVEEFPEAVDTSRFSLAYSTLMPDGDEYISDEDLASFLVYCIEETAGGNWSNFEAALGEIEWSQFFDEVDDVMDRDGEIDPWKTAYAREDFTTMLSFNTSAFSKLFSRWINTISYPTNCTCNNFLSDEIKNSSIFLTFNYTKTLEDIYDISSKQICHIHGVQGGEIIVGHGIDNINDDEDEDEDYFERSYDFGMEGIDDIHNSLRKPTKKIIEHTPFFNELQNHSVENIFSWGFSFSEVDQCYIKEICNRLDTKSITWHLYDIGNDEPEKFREILLKCGFKGIITTFKA